MSHILSSRDRKKHLREQKLSIALQASAILSGIVLLLSFTAHLHQPTPHPTPALTHYFTQIGHYTASLTSTASQQKATTVPSILTTIGSPKTGQGGPLNTITLTVDKKNLQQMLEILAIIGPSHTLQSTQQRTEHIPSQHHLFTMALLPTTTLDSHDHITSGFGPRIDPFTGEYALHHGVDFYAPAGAPLSAIDHGTVTQVTYSPTYGNMIEIDHGNDWQTRYAHCSRILVQPGTIVRKGETIALIGSTGRSTSPHLHFETLYKGTHQNPIYLLSRLEHRHHKRNPS